MQGRKSYLRWLPRIRDSLHATAGHDMAGPVMAGNPAPPDLPVTSSSDIAIVGMAVRVPDGDQPQDLWSRLVAPAGAGDAIASTRIRADVDFPDALFAMPPRPHALDRHDAVLLATIWDAMEDAGWPPRGMAGQECGVFVAGSGQDRAGTGFARHYPSTLAATLSFHFDLKGPSETVEAACAGSLLAIHKAVRALAAGDCGRAIAGGVFLLDPKAVAAFSEDGILSSDGRCRPFDREAAGYVLAEAAAVLMLRPLAEAVAAGDRIHAVIRGTAARHGGRGRSLHTLDEAAVAAAARQACAVGGIDPASIGFVQCQGAGLPRGDACELRGLAAAYGGAGRVDPLMVTCLKPHLGHLEAAAGAASVCAAALALKQGEVPGLRQFSEPHPEVAAAGPFSFAAAARPCPPSPAAVPLRAGISGFAYGGTVVHLVLEAPPAPATSGASAEGSPVLVLLSAHSADVLRRRAVALRDWLTGAGAAVPLSDIGHTLMFGRDEMAHRLAIGAGGHDDLVAALTGFLGAGAEAPPSCCCGVVESSPGIPVDDDDLRYLRSLAQRGAIGKLGMLWARGFPVPWSALAIGRSGRITSLPHFPFDATPDVRHPAVPAGATPVSAPVGTFLSVVQDVLGLNDAEGMAERTLPGLGLDSLKAQILRSRLRTRFGLDLPVARLLSSARLGQLAAEFDASCPSGAPDPETTDRFEPFPLTDIQRAYWLGRSDAIALGGRGCSLYWEFARDTWDVDRLDRAWARLVARHDMLRAVFSADARQQVRRHAPAYAIARHDWSGLPPEQVEAAREDLRARLADRVFDLESGPLFDIAVSIAPDGMRLHFAIDLIVADAHSLFLLLGEWAALYDDPDRILPPPGASFRDVALAWRAAPADEAALSWWHDRLDRMPPAPMLPMRADPAAVAAPRFHRRSARLSAARLQDLRAAAAAHDMTVPMLLMAAFSDVLSLWSGMAGFTLNVTLNARDPDRPELAGVVGDFTSNLLLAVDWAGHDALATKARRLVQDLAEALDQSRVGGVQVLAELSRRRGERVLMPVVFTSMLGFADGAGRPFDIEALGRFVDGSTQTPQVWLDAQAVQLSDGLLLSWDSVDALFSDGLLDGMFACFVDLVERLAADAAIWSRPTPLAALPATQRRVRDRANDTAVPRDPERIQDGFLAQAKRRPDAPAVIAPDRTLSYGELHARAAVLAQALVETDLRPNQLVAIVMPKCWEQVVAALAVAMAGGAYLPIDEALPAPRIAELVALGEARTVLLREDAPKPADLPATTCCLRVARGAAPAGASAEPPETAVTPDDLAYVIFTSGSTGTPKGVMVAHRAAANTIADINVRFGVGDTDRTLALSSLSFDLSVYDIFGLLAAGGGIVVPDPARQRDPAYLADLARGTGVTLWNTVPSYLQMMVDAAAARSRTDALPDLRVIMLSGDWIPVPLAATVRRLFPEARFYSLGGATEASIWSIFHPIGTVDPAASSIPYGKPLANQRFHVLRPDHQDCPDWVEGDLFIAGDGLAEGYWRDEATTARAFVRQAGTGERLYRTGDRGRYRGDGVIEFLGRVDQQVKIGGHRVELGEVEAALSRHPGIDAAVALTLTDVHGQKRLAAAFVPARGGAIGTRDLRDHLRDVLPGYMVPTTLLPLDALPLTGNGKVDRAAIGRRLEAANDTRPSSAGDRGGGFLDGLAAPEVIKDKAARDAFIRTAPGNRRDLADCAWTTLPGEPAAVPADRLRVGRSHRRFSDAPLPPDSLARLLEPLRSHSVDGTARHRFPSAGGSYAVQTYLHLRPGAVEGMAGGFYYHQPATHALARLGDGTAADLHLPANAGFAAAAGLTIFLIADLAAIRPLYGAAGADMARLEAGHIGQLLMEAVPASGIGLCPIGHLDAGPLRAACRLGPDHELLYAFVGGGTVDAADAEIPRAAAVRPAAGRRTAVAAVAEPFGNDALRAAVGAVWAQILGHRDFTATDNFFEVGGNSFSIIELQAGLEAALGRACTVTELFTHTTIADQAAHFDGARPAPPPEPTAVAVAGPASRGDARRRVRASVMAS